MHNAGAQLVCQGGACKCTYQHCSLKSVEGIRAGCHGDMQGSADAELAYARLEALCQAVKGELQQDLHIHDAAVLPNFVNLPKVTAAEYGRVSKMHQL